MSTHLGPLLAPLIWMYSVAMLSLPWTPVLGLLRLQHLELTIRFAQPWLKDLMADLSLCSCLETLKFADEGFWYEDASMHLPNLLLHDVATLRSVELLGWYPEGRMTLPPGCLLRWLVTLETRAQWDEWQRKLCPTTILLLICMDLQEWPTGIHKMSGLQFLDLYCTKLANQDLAALQHIPHVKLGFQEYSTFLLTSGSWQSLDISGDAGFNVKFENLDAFVRATERFLFRCPSQQAREMFSVLHAACMRQGSGLSQM